MSNLDITAISTIIKALGGKKNIVRIENCLTRVRVKVYDLTKTDLESIDAISGIIGASEVDDSIHIIMGVDKARPLAQQLNDSLKQLDDSEIVKILEFIGGKDNIREIDNCFVRLRLTLNDISKADFNAILNLEAVSSVVKNDDGQLHIVLGPIQAREAANKLKALV